MLPPSFAAPPGHLAPGPGKPPLRPPLASLLAVLPVVGLAWLHAALTHAFPAYHPKLGLEGLAAVPVLCGALAATLLLRHPTPRRAEFWKCSIWVWTWLLLATVPAGSGFELIILFPFLFYYHLGFIALAAVGVEFGKFASDLRRGRLRLPAWINPAWYLLVVGLLGATLLGVIAILVHRQL